MNRSKWEMSIKQLRTYQVFIVAIVIILFGCHALDAAIISNSGNCHQNIKNIVHKYGDYSHN